MFVFTKHVMGFTDLEQGFGSPLLSSGPELVK